MKIEHLYEMTDALNKKLLFMRSESDGAWRGNLSSSAISTALAIFALHLIDREKHSAIIKNGIAWLKQTMLPEGAWGDTSDSLPSLTATLLSFAALQTIDTTPEKTKNYLSEILGGLEDEQIINNVLSRHREDLNLSLPVLTICALTGVVKKWKNIPHVQKHNNTNPALLALDVFRRITGNKADIFHFQELSISKALRALDRLQSENGGFFEIIPLTAFVAICTASTGFTEHRITQRAALFLSNTVRNDGAWSLNIDLACRVTALNVRALGNSIKHEDREELSQLIRNNALKNSHPITRTNQGGWSWTASQDALPNADDTAASLIALHILNYGQCCLEAEQGIEWLLDMQNHDGGIATFFKGHGEHSFEKSSADVTAHVFYAFELWQEVISEKLKIKIEKATERMLDWLKSAQNPDGSWTSLWFDDQDATDKHSSVLGTAVVLDNINASSKPTAMKLAAKAAVFLVANQNADKGWGGSKNSPSKITVTAKATSALATYLSQYNETIVNGFEFLYGAFQKGKLEKNEPVGLCFTHLWYAEEQYNICFTLNALKNIDMANKLAGVQYKLTY